MALRDDSKDVERLFTVLVESLAHDAARLRNPLQVSEIYLELVPYRTHRSHLGIDANQDYEMALLRLLAGEGAYAAVQPEEARALLAEEAASPDPDSSLVREYAGATVTLDAQAVARVLQRESGFGPAPVIDETAEPATEAASETTPDPEATSTPRPVTRPSIAPVFALEPEVPPAAPDPEPAAQDPVTVGGSCKACGRMLPLHRPVTYCPFCGRRAGVHTCTACGEAFEPGWRFCVACGAPPSR